MDVRRSQELVVRIWGVGAAGTALPLALVKADTAPFPPALGWGFGLAILGLLSAFAARATGQNSLALEQAQAARGEHWVDSSVSPWRGASVRTLQNASWLFRAMTAVYGAAATMILARAFSWNLSSFELVALSLPWLVGLAVGVGKPRPSAAPLPRVSVMPKEKSVGQTTTNFSTGRPKSSRPSLEFEQIWQSPDAPSAPALSAFGGASRPSSLSEALGSIFPEGVTLRPELVTKVRHATEHQVTRYEPNAGRHDSGVQELRKQPLTEPKRRQTAHHEAPTRLSQIATEPPPSTAVIESSERDTERPPSRRTDRSRDPMFVESEIPTTPAPASVREATPPDGPASLMMAFELKIPKSPKAPTFGRSGRALSGPDPEQSFRPTRRAGPFVERGASDAISDAFSRPTRPAEAGGDGEAHSSQVTARPPNSQSGEHAVQSPDETPKPASFTRDAGTSLRPLRSQFEIAYNGRGGPGYVEPGDGASEDGVREAAPKSSDSAGAVGAARDSGGSRGSPLESEIRWVESSRSTIPAMISLEADLLQALQSAVPRPSAAARRKRKTALH